MQKPDITIITDTSNAAATVERTLHSVERQSFHRFEHIIVDGASTDATVHLVKAYQRRNSDRDITLISEPDRGLYDAFNKGIACARGTYLVFLNAGDTLHDVHTLERVMQAANNPSSATGKAAPSVADGTASSAALPAVIYGETNIVDDSGKFLHPRRLKIPKRLTWRSFQQGMLVCHQSFYALRSLAPLYDLSYRFSADFDWCVRLLKAAQEQGLETRQVDAVLTDYLAEGMTTRNHHASLRERYRIMAHHYGRIRTFLLHGWFALRAIVKR